MQPAYVAKSAISAGAAAMAGEEEKEPSTRQQSQCGKRLLLPNNSGVFWFVDAFQSCHFEGYRVQDHSKEQNNP